MTAAHILAAPTTPHRRSHHQGNGPTKHRPPQQPPSMCSVSPFRRATPHAQQGVPRSAQDRKVARFRLDWNAELDTAAAKSSATHHLERDIRSPARKRQPPTRKHGLSGCWGAIRARKETSGYVLHLGPRLERGGRRTTASRQSRDHKATSLTLGVKPKPLRTRAIQPSGPAPSSDTNANHQPGLELSDVTNNARHHPPHPATKPLLTNHSKTKYPSHRSTLPPSPQ